MLELLTGHWIAQMLYAVVELGVADAMGTKALATDSIAERVGANAARVAWCARSRASACSSKTTTAVSS
jgi:hypothetical protein